MKPKFFRNFFGQKGSLESCRVAYEKTTSVPIMGFEKNTVKGKNFSRCHEICEKQKHRRNCIARRPLDTRTAKIKLQNYTRYHAEHQIQSWYASGSSNQKKIQKTGTLEKFSKKSEKNRFFDKFLSLEKTLDHQYLTQLVWDNKLQTSEGNLM